jgi:anti-sigma regulatory factor (Ser/Thr protein kinase)
VKGIEIRIPTYQELLEPLQVLVERLGAIAGVEGEELTPLSISVLELVKNGMEHGNGMDPEKHITIFVDVLPGRLQFQVVDCGTWKADQDLGYKPGEGEELFSDRGRGVLIAKNLAKWVEFDLTPDGFTRATLIWPLT